MTRENVPAQGKGMTHSRGNSSSSPAATNTARTGRPRRNVRLAPPTVRPLLGTEHQDAVSALSALLGDLTGFTTSVAVVTQTVDGTQQILAELSSPTATIVTPTHRRRVA